MQLICDESEGTAHVVLSEVAPCLRRPRIVFAMRGLLFCTSGRKKNDQADYFNWRSPDWETPYWTLCRFIEESSSYAKRRQVSNVCLFS